MTRVIHLNLPPRPNLYTRLEEAQRRQAVLADEERDLRAMRRRRSLVRVGWTCYAILTLVACYYAFRAGYGR